MMLLSFSRCIDLVREELESDGREREGGKLKDHARA